MENQNEHKLMTISEAMEYLNIGRKGLLILFESGQLGYVKFGRCKMTNKKFIAEMQYNNSIGKNKKTIQKPKNQYLRTPEELKLLYKKLGQ